MKILERVAHGFGQCFPYFQQPDAAATFVRPVDQVSMPAPVVDRIASSTAAQPLTLLATADSLRHFQSDLEHAISAPAAERSMRLQLVARRAAALSEQAHSAALQILFGLPLDLDAADKTDVLHTLLFASMQLPPAAQTPLRAHFRLCERSLPLENTVSLLDVAIEHIESLPERERAGACRKELADIGTLPRAYQAIPLITLLRQIRSLPDAHQHAVYAEMLLAVRTLIHGTDPIVAHRAPADGLPDRDRVLADPRVDADNTNELKTIRRVVSALVDAAGHLPADTRAAELFTLASIAPAFPDSVQRAALATLFANVTRMRPDDAVKVYIQLRTMSDLLPYTARPHVDQTMALDGLPPDVREDELRHMHATVNREMPTARRELT